MSDSNVENDVLKIDPYMAIPEADVEGITFHSPFEKPFRLAGSAFQDKWGKLFCRMPEKPVVSGAVTSLARNTSGFQLQFKSTSRKVLVKAKLRHGNLMDHMPQTGSSSFDLYVGGPGNWRMMTSSRYPLHAEEYTYTLFDREAPGLREFLINFPLYNGVESVWIGLESGCEIYAPTPWSCDKPVVVYGTSITQGGCASRPGGSWTNILSRWHNCEFYNFGFSGSGRGEAAAAEILASIPDPRCYILDYEPNAHNAGTRATLETFLDILRSKHPDVPITVISKTPHRNMLSFGADDDTDVIYEDSFLSRTFQREVIARRRAAGDTNLYFVNGIKLLGDDWDECMMDGCHFNDLGFYRMAENLNKYLKF